MGWRGLQCLFDRRVGAAARVVVLFLAVALVLDRPAQADAALPRFLDDVTPQDLNADADAFGPLDKGHAVVPLLRDGEPVGYGFLNSDVATSVGYSGKPILIVVGLSLDDVIMGAKVVPRRAGNRTNLRGRARYCRPAPY